MAGQVPIIRINPHYNPQSPERRHYEDDIRGINDSFASLMTWAQTAFEPKASTTKSTGSSIYVPPSSNTGSGGSSTGTASISLAAPVSLFTVNGTIAPVTNNSFVLGLIPQGANTFFRGPTSGADAIPGFGGIVDADLPVTAVTPGSYTNTSLTVDQYGRLTAANSGPPPSESLVPATVTNADSPYTITTADVIRFFPMAGSGGDIDATLPMDSGSGSARAIYLINRGDSDVNLSPAGSYVIYSGGAPVTPPYQLLSGNVVQIVSDGAGEWDIIV